MKTLLIALLTVAGVSAFAKSSSSSNMSRPYGLAGCGLGSIVMGKDGSQLSAATTNGTGGQTFAISTGTSNCKDDPNAAMASNMDKFIIANRVAITSDIARGNGETIAGLAQIMGCQADAEAIGSSLQRNYKAIFSSENQVVNRITDSILQTIYDDEQLSHNCHLG
jgi:hypothetical protein